MGRRREACKGGGQFAGPGPGLVEMHDEVTAAVGEDGGHVQDPVAHGLGLGLGQGALETGHLAPGQQ